MDDINKEDIDKIYELDEELQSLRTDIKAMQSQAIAKHGDREHEIERGGEEVTVTEEELWNELKDPNATSEGKKQAKEVLKQEHGTLFEKMNEEKELAKAIEKQFTEVFGFSQRSMTPGRMLRVVETFVDYYTD